MGTKNNFILSLDQLQRSPLLSHHSLPVLSFTTTMISMMMILGSDDRCVVVMIISQSPFVQVVCPHHYILSPIFCFFYALHCYRISHGYIIAYDHDDDIDDYGYGSFSGGDDDHAMMGAYRTQQTSHFHFLSYFNVTYFNVT